MGLSDPRGFVSDLGLQFFALGAGSALSLVRLLIACLRNCYSVPDGCCIMLYPALHKLDSRLSIRFLQGIVVAQWIQLQSTATVRPVQYRNLCHTASTHTEGGCQCGRTSRRACVLAKRQVTYFIKEQQFFIQASVVLPSEASPSKLDLHN